MIEVSIVDIVKKDGANIVFLKEKKGERILPIWVGEFEAAAIATGLRAFPTIRPMTFDFITSLLQAMGGELAEVRVEALKEDIYYGIARLRGSQGDKEIDARPSDILALAARTGSPIFVAEEALDKAGKPATEFQAVVGEEGFLPLGQNIEAFIQEYQEQIQKALASIRGSAKDKE